MNEQTSFEDWIAHKEKSEHGTVNATWKMGARSAWKNREAYWSKRVQEMEAQLAQLRYQIKDAEFSRGLNRLHDQYNHYMSKASQTENYAHADRYEGYAENVRSQIDKLEEEYNEWQSLTYKPSTVPKCESQCEDKDDVLPSK